MDLERYLMSMDLVTMTGTVMRCQLDLNDHLRVRGNDEVVVA